MSEEEEEVEKPFAIERAKTGRAKCKKCKCPIESGAIRIAKLMSNPFGEGKMKAWHHVTCLFEVFAKQRATTKRIDDPEEDVSGWDALTDEDRRSVLEKIEEFEKSCPLKNTKATTSKAGTRKKNFGSQAKTKAVEEPATGSGSSTSQVSVRKIKESPKVFTPTKDDLFREFRRLCADIANVDAYSEKTAIVKKMLTKGSAGDRFKGDTILWCKMLLPGSAKKVYNLQSKQLIKLFSRILCQDEESMLEHLEQGDIAETIRVFFENSAVVTPASKSVLTMQEVDAFLHSLSFLTKEEEQMDHFRTILGRSTGNDLKMIIRLIKHDLRINAGPKHILGAIHDDAYKAFQVSNNLEAVVERCLDDPSISTESLEKSPTTKSGDNKVALSIMTPVLPMLAEACKSVDMAMKKCPHGMLAEVKYDGERVQVHKRGSEFRYFSRSLKPVLPHKVNLFKEYIPKAFPDGDDLILDSEVLLIDTKTGQPLPFGSLGIHKKAEFKDATVCLFIFDCIYYNGEILMNKTMQERRQILKDRITEIPNRIMLSEVQKIHKPYDLAEMIAKVFKLGLEGLVLKDVNSKYEPGKRYWLKVKKDYLFDGAMADTADLVVLGAWYGTGNKGGIMSIFLMGCYDEDCDKWLTVTKVHTGHDDATLAMLQTELEMVKIGKDSNKVPSWLLAKKPMIPDFVARDPKKQPVWEITGAEFTNQGVHTADSISIRFPRVTRIRRDKDWTTATSLKELRQLFKRSSESMDFSLLLGSNSETKKEDDNDIDTLDISPKKTTDTSKIEKTAISQKRKRLEKLDLNDEEEREPKIKIKEHINNVKKEYECADKKPGISSIKMRKKSIDSNLELKREPSFKDKASTSDYICNVNIKKEPICEETLSGHNFDNEFHEDNRAKYYSFVGKDYIEYNAAGSPLNWIESRKPKKGLPVDAKPLVERNLSDMASKCVFKDVRVTLARNFKRNKRKEMLRTLKTLGATIMSDADRSKWTHIIHDCTEIPSTALQEFRDVPKTVRHVNVSWVERSAASSEMQDVYRHAVELAADYCDCPCRHR